MVFRLYNGSFDANTYPVNFIVRCIHAPIHRRLVCVSINWYKFLLISQHILDGIDFAHRIKREILVIHNHVILPLGNT